MAPRKARPCEHPVCSRGPRCAPIAGQNEQAIALLRLTYMPLDEDKNFGWNFYMDGTIAFLKRDKEALSIAIERLKAIPNPGTKAVYADGRPAKIKWPPNLDVLEAFERCWDRPFAEALSSYEKCRRAEDRSFN